MLKQVIGGLNEVPQTIGKALRDRRRVIGGHRLAAVEIVEFLQDIFSQRTSISLDALEACPARQRAKLLDSLSQILQKWQGTRIFPTGRQHILGEVEKHLAARAETRSITGTEDDIVIFPPAKLKEDTIPDAMDKSLEEEIINIITATISEMWVACSIYEYLSVCAK